MIAKFYGSSNQKFLIEEPNITGVLNEIEKIVLSNDR
jgi:hypothetical protein